MCLEIVGALSYTEIRSREDDEETKEGMMEVFLALFSLLLLGI